MTSKWYLGYIASIALLGSPVNSSAAILFQDNFNDGDANGWSFFGNNQAGWSVVNGRLEHSTPGYDGTSSFALINGINTLSQFKFEADISVITSNQGSDRGHAGVAWAVDTTSAPYNYNTAYLRTHWDHVTYWSITNNLFSGENYLNTAGTINDQTYHLTVEVDAINQIITTSLDNFSTTFTGAAYHQINANLAGGVGLISWQDHIAYDNVVISSPVPVPGALVLFATGLLSLLGLRKKAVSTN